MVARPKRERCPLHRFSGLVFSCGVPACKQELVPFAFTCFINVLLFHFLLSPQIFDGANIGRRKFINKNKPEKNA
jgi:hypothetical protein